MKIDSEAFRVLQGEVVDLANRSTAMAPLCKSDKQVAARLQKHVEHLSAAQQLLYAANRQAVLLIFQGMDSAGVEQSKVTTGRAPGTHIECGQLQLRMTRSKHATSPLREVNQPLCGCVDDGGA